MNQAKRFLVLALAVATLSALSLAANIPNGTRVQGRTVSRMDSGTSRAGQGGDGSLAKDVVVNGTTYAHAGDPVHGVISVAKDSGRLHAPGVLSIRVTSVAGNPVTSTAYSVDRKSTRLNSSHVAISYAVFCLKKKTTEALTGEGMVHGMPAGASSSMAASSSDPL